MRGEPLEIAVPTQGLVRNVTPDKVPQGALIDGQNMWLDIDGFYKVRYGYQPFPIGGGNLNIGPIIGAWWWIDTANTNQYLAVSPTKVAWFNGTTWVDVTGTPLTGSVNDPVQFQSYFQNGVINIIIANNHDPLQVFSPNYPTVLPLTPTYAAAGTNAYTAATTPTFTAYPVNSQLFFTFANANTGNVTLQLNGLGVVPVRALIGGVISELPVGYLAIGVTYNLSYDGTQFLVGTNLTAPVARAICVVAGRVLAINITNGSIVNSTQVTWTAAFDMTVWPALAFQNLVDFDDPLVNIKPIGSFAAVLDGMNSLWLAQAVSGVTDPFAFNFTPIRGANVGNVSASGAVVAEGYIYYFGTDFRIWQTDGSSAWPISAAIDPVLRADVNGARLTQIFAFFNARERQVWFVYPSTSSSLDGPSKAVIYDLGRGVFEPIQVFSEVLRSGIQMQIQRGVRWQDLTQPWSSYNVAWNSFAVTNQQGVFLGTDGGFMQNFSDNSLNDNGGQIPYSFTPALLSHGSRQDVLIDSWDIFFKPSLNFELSTLAFYSLTMPEAAPTVLTATAFDLSSADTYGIPKSLPTQNKYSRYLMLTFSGNSYARAFSFAGGTVFVQKQERPSQVAK